MMKNSYSDTVPAIWTEENFDFARVEHLRIVEYQRGDEWLVSKLHNLKTIKLVMIYSFQDLSDLANMILDKNSDL